MEKLELKHLAPYLPYGLKIRDIAYPSTFEMNLKTISLSLENNDYNKPILRPLSDLKKGFYVNDEEITPCDYFEEQHDYAKIQSELENMSNHNYCDGWLPYFVQQKLIEWNFDVFGLIPKGLAVDINTLNK